MDLAMKLHYIKGIYLFQSDAVKGLAVNDLKKPMFQLLQLYFAGLWENPEIQNKPAIPRV
ncbi:hypothetical protein RchiOBHm_Chr1g0364531 [Rosa chinensis]|uniref:Uncharacterized protein n=1 Tax=Rosa chinensis TaxID=74649 RepID=A0A2P6SJR6_ROSCH|nr:hypothetical protein RchiOBHm_Chr1g0364531 [Rosa chinensis]